MDVAPLRSARTRGSAPAVSDWLRRAAAQGLERFEAEILLAAALGRDRAWLYAHPEAVPSGAGARRLARWIARRGRGEPLAYLLGVQPFRGLPILVGRAVLIPRPETEELVDLALAMLARRRGPQVLELGTGSGAVAVALARERPDARIVATELCPRALAVARRNAARLAPGRIDFRRGDWYRPVAGERFDLIVANPPYVAAADPALVAGELRHEPRRALAGGEDGLASLRAVVDGAPAHLAAQGSLIVEHGADQGPSVRALLVRAGFVEVKTHRDLAGRERFAAGVLTVSPGTR